jgi:cold shock CspA family protein
MATGTVKWFNDSKGYGFISPEDEGERLSVLGSGFAEGERPKGRCAHAVVSFVIHERDGERQAQMVTFVQESSTRRARLRTRGARTR